MKKTGLFLLILVLPFLTGCFSTSRYFDAVRNDVLRNVKGNFSTDVEFSIGPVGLSLARMFVDSEEDPEASEILKDISLVQVGVYKRQRTDEKFSKLQLLKRIDRQMNENGWQYIVKNSSPDEVSAVYVNSSIKKGFKRIFVVSLNKEELVLVQINGKLNHIIETAIRDKGLNHNF